MNEHDAALKMVVDGLPVAEINPGKIFDMGKAALFYAERLRWPVIPIHHPMNDPRAPFGLSCSCGKECDSPGKHPMTANGLDDASLDPAVISAWWRRWPQANIAVRTGIAETGGCGFDVIDVDGEQGWQSWSAWLEDGDTPTIEFEAFTPGNRKRGVGRHLYVVACGTENKSNVLPLIDTRGDRGYVVTAPSRGMTGGRYAWVTPPEVSP